ncbi:MAG: hypothetical protein QY331_01790 [Melioribacteraceae bacterium]|nr:MAG: hypothetical protein QY331_01790 [Melioribacteraceae bacterium]
MADKPIGSVYSQRNPNWFICIIIVSFLKNHTNESAIIVGVLGDYYLSYVSFMSLQTLY